MVGIQNNNMNNDINVESNLEKAIKSYCSMLAYPNIGASPCDDKRLYTISRLAAKNDNTPITTEMLIPHLKENPKTDLDNEGLNKFAENRCNEINRAAYIISKAFKKDEL